MVDLQVATAAGTFMRIVDNCTFEAVSPHTGLLVFPLGTLPPVRLFARPSRRSSVVLCWFSRMDPTRAAGV